MAGWVGGRAALVISVLFSVLLVCLQPTAAQKFQRAVKQVDYLDDRARFQPAWDALVAELPAATRFFSIAIEEKRITVQATTGNGKVDRWTVQRARFLGLFERDLVSGPYPMPAPAAFDSALFGLDDVALDQLATLIEQAIARAALEDPARLLLQL